MTQWLTLHGLFTVIGLLVYVVAAHLLEQRRHPTAAIAWVLFILLLPYVALPLFLTFGSRKTARPSSVGRAQLPASPAPTPQGWAQRTLQALRQPPPVPYAGLQLHADGSDALRALWRTLDAAQQSIDVCTFILGRDALGREVIDRLAAKARAGVRVRLLLDGLGSLMAGRPDLRPLTESGAAVTLFVPPLHSPLKGRTNLRNHRKMLIVDAGTDSARLWCGGRNLASEYFEGDAARPPWHDLSFDLGGALVQQCAALFERDWAFATTRRAPVAPVDADTSSAPDGAQLIASGPDQVDDTIYSVLLSAAFQARERIVVVTPYFVPDAASLMALCLAARRGVVVDVLLPAKSNHRLSDVARHRGLRALAQAGARIWLAPQMLHAKLALVDDTLALAGSANFDGRSLFLNYELMVAFHDRADVQRFAAWFAHERASARPYSARRPGLLRDLAEGMVLWVGFQL